MDYVKCPKCGLLLSVIAIVIRSTQHLIKHLEYATHYFFLNISNTLKRAFLSCPQNIHQNVSHVEINNIEPAHDNWVLIAYIKYGY